VAENRNFCTTFRENDLCRFKRIMFKGLGADTRSQTDGRTDRDCVRKDLEHKLLLKSIQRVLR
jgi:hypothetical protein